MATPKTAMKIIFGTMTFAKEGTLVARTTDVADASAILDVFQKHGHSEIDTARIYGDGTSETMLGELGWQERGLVAGTKLYPNNGNPLFAHLDETFSHSAADVRKGLLRSLEALRVDKVDLFYLHGPDRSVPFEETLREVHALHREGYFARFGISNYMSWEVARICELCKKNGWIAPTVYQGCYNALRRNIEPELMPCLRHYGIALYAFQPLASGFLTSRYRREARDDPVEPGSRFDSDKLYGKIQRARFFNDAYFDAIETIRAVCGVKYGLTEAECGLRWLVHHSQAKAELGDAIIVGASSAEMLEQNLVDLEKGPLSEEVVEALDKAWGMVKAVATVYYH